MRAKAHHPTEPSLPGLLAEWVDAGLITAEQATTIRDHEARTHPRRPPLTVVPPAPPAGAPTGSLVIEALGYLGGVIMLVGSTILVGLYWEDMSVALRLAILAATAVGLVGAGYAVPDRLGAAAGRLRSVLWALGVVATGAFMAVVASDALDRYDEDALIVIFPPTALLAGVLWWLRRTWLQQLALLVPLLMSGAAVTMQATGTESAAAGATVWGVAIAWSALAWTGRLEPRMTGVGLGALGAVFGSLLMDNDVGILLGLLTAAAMVALALVDRSLPWLGVATIALLYTAPRAAVQWFPGRLSAALTLIVTGGLLVGAAVWVARHGRDGGLRS